MLGPNEFRCASCGVVLQKGWSDDEALEEMREVLLMPDELGQVPPGTIIELDTVCDDCWPLLVAFAREHGLTRG